MHDLLPRFRFPDGELDSWTTLGDITDRSVRVWVRNPSGPIDARLLVDGAEVGFERLQPDPERDHVAAAVLRVDEPRPGGEFEVRVGGDVVRRARFAPAPDGDRRFSFAFGSCHQPFTEQLDEAGAVDRHPGAAIYPRITSLFLERGLSFAMWLGDQVYSDAVSEMSVRERLSNDETVTDEMLVETYRHLYRGFFNERGYRELAEALPSYLMWDDHDIFDGWGSLMDHTAFDERVYRAAERAFVEYQHLRNPGATLESRPPFGYSFWRGDVGFHVPDLRGERDFEKGQVMGAAGWKLLDDFLARSTDRAVPTVFIAASVPVVHASPALMRAMERLKTSAGRDVRDRWSVPTFAAERARLFDRLFAWQSAEPRRQVFVISGDVHVGAAFSVRPRRGTGHFRQWTSSALSTPDGLKHVLANELITRFVRVGEHEVRVWRRGLATSNNVGVVDVEPVDQGGHNVTLGVYEFDAKKDSLTLALSDTARPR
jgi:phosphodiesterase/alkaline phosphatase D-like protein